MLQDTNNVPTLKVIEEEIFRHLQNCFQTVMLKVLEDIDVWLMENRDHKRFAYRERQASTMDTMFGSITIKRRKYVDRETNERVALLDRYHLKQWIKQTLSNRSKEVRKRVYEAADANDPSAMLAAIAEAEKAETDVEKQKEIAGLREFILENQKAFRDYRDRLQEKGVDTSAMRPMGSAESNMNLMSKRLKKNGYSWSLSGLGAMVNAMIHRLEGTLVDVLRPSATEGVSEKAHRRKSPLWLILLDRRHRNPSGRYRVVYRY